MKKLLTLTAFLISTISCLTSVYAQNVGVGSATPSEKLDVNGAVRVGTTSSTNAGTIRWNSPNFQGYDGTQWVNFGGGTLTGSGTATRVAFWDGTSSLSSNANLYWDNTNSRLGIGTATPSYTLQIYHTATNQGAGFFRVDNSSNNGSAVFASTNGGGSSSAIYAVNNGWGRAANFEINNSASDRHAIYASTNGVGHTIRVDQAGSGGRALYLQTGSSSNSSPTLYSNTFGTGRAGEFRIDNSGSSSAALYASTSGTGPAIEAGGKLKSTTFQMTTSPTVNYVLRSDASGNATWVDPNTLVTGLLPSGTTGQTLRHNGTNWIANSMIYNSGTTVGIGTASPSAILHVAGASWQLDLQNPTNDGQVGMILYEGLSTAALIHHEGDFASGYLEIEDYSAGWATTGLVVKQGNIGIGTTAPGTKLEVAGQVKITGGTPGANKVLTSDATGLATWEPAQGDNLGDHTATTNIQLNNNWLSNDGGNEGIRVDNSGNVGIGQTPGSAYLDITGTNAGSTSLQLRSGNTGVGTSSNQLTFGYSGAETYRHAIKTRHNSGGNATNAIDFYLWNYGTDAVGTVGTQHVMTIDGGNGGSVGIGTSAPGYKLTVNGEPAANGYTAFTNYSDARLKTNITEVESSLTKIMSLRPVQYNYNENYLKLYDDASTLEKVHKGFIAQEIKEVFPEMVGQVNIKGTDYYDLNLSNLQIYMVKAMQEQQAIIEAMKKEIEALKSKVK
jgi:hypothetical protein